MGPRAWFANVTLVAVLVAATSVGAGTTTYQYDLDGRISSVIYGGGPALAYAFDAAGNLSLISSFAITTNTLPPPVIGVAYSQTIATVGGVSPVTFSATGALPAGLSLNPTTGLISGAATTAAAYSFTITATDNTGLTASQTYASSSSAALVITTASIAAFKLSTAYSQTLATSGGASPLTFLVTAGALPSGVSLGASGQATGLLFGTPSASGPFSFTITASDTVGHSASQTYSGTI